MTMYFFHQEVEKGKWLPALASERERLIQTKKPALVSALDVDSSFDHDLTLEETRALRYSGPMYFDWDAENLEEATQQFQKFLTNLKAKGVNLDMLRLYNTGKKGYHLEIPMPVFMGKPPANGTLFLPDMYREVAHSLFVETLDLRVYTARRGRMWRCPNVLRDNGKYKVQITPEEAFSMDTEKYMQICSVPRLALPTEPPALNAELGLLFAQARDKVEAGAAKKKSKKQASDQLEKFKGQWPDTLQNIFTGAVIKPGVGWNHISLQLCIAASELGKSEEDLLADAAPLINSHESDSTRYNTPAKRTADLRDMHRYVVGNPCYEYSPGGLLSLLLPEVRANADISFGEWQPDEAPAAPIINEDGTIQEVPEAEDDAGPIRLSKNGIFVRTDDGYKSVCDLGLMKPVAMSQLNGDQIGYELDVTLDGKSKGKRFLPMNALATKGQFNSWALSMGASMKGSDTQTSSLADIFRKRSSKTVYAVEREGIDIITPPGASGPDDYDVIWASPLEVKCNRADTHYRFHGVYNAQGTYHSDLMSAPDLSVEDADFVSDLLTINTPANLAKMLGWFSAAFLTQLIRKKFKRFPSLQIHGQAGSGKSMSVILLNHMHYHMTEPRQFSVAGQTMFPIIAAVASSASIPLVFEELKSRQLAKHAKDFLQNILRSNYTADQLSRGGLTRDKSVRELTVTDFQNAAPVVFVGEALEDQAALLERCVCVALSKSNRVGRDKQFERCLDKAQTMGKIGKAMAAAAMALNRDTLADTVTANFKTITGKVSQAMADDATRPAFNLAVTLTGLEFLKSTFNQVFGTKFDAQMDELRESIVGNVMDSIPKNMSEASRVLDTMAALTRHTDVQYQMELGTDYTVSEDGRFVDLKVRTAYDKYVRYQRSLGMEVLYDTYNTFQVSLSNYGGVVKRACPENVQLFDSPKATIFRLSAEYMDKENVDSFKS